MLFFVQILFKLISTVGLVETFLAINMILFVSTDRQLRNFHEIIEIFTKIYWTIFPISSDLRSLFVQKVYLMKYL